MSPSLNLVGQQKKLPFEDKFIEKRKSEDSSRGKNNLKSKGRGETNTAEVGISTSVEDVQVFENIPNSRADEKSFNRKWGDN